MDSSIWDKGYSVYLTFITCVRGTAGKVPGFSWEAFQCGFEGWGQQLQMLLHKCVNVADGFQSDRGEVTAVAAKMRLISDNQNSLAADISYDDE